MHTFQLFVYGLEKRRMPHHHFCRRAVKIENAVVCGKLYQLPPGYPALEVPRESILWTGSRDVFKDAQEQDMENCDGNLAFEIHDGWTAVHGELLTFSDPERDMPPIDKLYWHPFVFERHLVPAKSETGSVMTAWAYTVFNVPVAAPFLSEGVWPKNRKVKPVKIDQD